MPVQTAETSYGASSAAPVASAKYTPTTQMASSSVDPILNNYASSKSRTIALLLAIFLGMFGAHRFYAGKIGTGVLYLFTLGICGVGWIYDIVMICLGRFTDKQELPLLNW